MREVARKPAISCPSGVLVQESALTPIADALRAAQRLLARQTLDSQGTVYHLTPGNAPINFIQQLVTGKSILDENVPGVIPLHRAAARLCGELTAQASWALHYNLPVAIIAGQEGYPFLVKTKTGWRFWGWWCGAGHSRQWSATHCR